MMLKPAQIKNTLKGLTCGGAEGWRRSVGPIVSKK